MAVDTTRLPQGIYIVASLAIALPVDSIIFDTTTKQLYRSTNASVATYVGLGEPIATVIADPGTGAAIPVTTSGSIALVIGTGAETNTLASPAFIGQELSIIVATAGGGTRTITAAAAINQAGNTKIAGTQAVDWIDLIAVATAVSGGTIRWRVRTNDGMTLS